MAPPTAKRPRSPAKGASEPSTKKKKTSKKKEKQKKNVTISVPPKAKQPPPPNSSAVSSAPPKQQATAKVPNESAPPDDSLIMARMIATFSHFEQSRFSAFTRAGISPPAVRDWVATVVRHRTQSSSVDIDPDTTLVVSMAAKSYAQRLLTAVGESVTVDKVLAAAERMPPRLYTQGTVGQMDSSSAEWDRKRLAALEAQEEYEKEFNTEESKKET